jgi:hypothetical protein
MSRKRAQEEIVGFVLIVVIVAVIFLVFLGMALRKAAPSTMRESRDVAQFIESLTSYTTDCAVSYEPAFSDIGGLTRDCYSGANCVNGKTACDVLNRTLREVIGVSWRVNSAGPIKGYVFNSTYSSKSTSKQVMLIRVGNCTGSIMGAENFFSAPPVGQITNTLKICY